MQITVETEQADIAAENDILIIHRLYPDMGGKVWYHKYDELLKKIQILRDQKPAGLQAAAGRTVTDSQERQRSIP